MQPSYNDFQGCNYQGTWPTDGYNILVSVERLYPCSSSTLDYYWSSFSPLSGINNIMCRRPSCSAL